MRVVIHGNRTTIFYGKRALSLSHRHARPPSLHSTAFSSIPHPPRSFTALPIALMRQLVNDALAFAGPLLLHQLVTVLDGGTPAVALHRAPPAPATYGAPPTPWWDGLACALAIGATSALRAFLGAHYSYRLARMGLKLRAAIATCVFAKVPLPPSLPPISPALHSFIRLKVGATHSLLRPLSQVLAVSAAQRGSFEGGEVQTLMSVDADRLVNLVMSLHDLWGLPLQILVALLLLYWQVSYAFLAGLAVVLLLIPVNRWLAGRIGEASKQMMASKDARVQAMQELLDHVAAVRAMAMEGALLSRINDARHLELSALAVRKYLDAWCVYFWACTPVLFSLATFSSLLLLGRSLNAPVVFTSLALFNVLLGPLNSFPWVINGIVEALISVRRLEAFLCIPTPPTAAPLVSAFTTPPTASSPPTAPVPTTPPAACSSTTGHHSSTLLYSLVPFLLRLPSSPLPRHVSPPPSPLTAPLLGPAPFLVNQDRDSQASDCAADGDTGGAAGGAVGVAAEGATSSSQGLPLRLPAANDTCAGAASPSPPLAVHMCGLSFSWHAPTCATSKAPSTPTGESVEEGGAAVQEGSGSRSTRENCRGGSGGSGIALHSIQLDVPEGAVVAIVGKVTPSPMPSSFHGAVGVCRQHPRERAARGAMGTHQVGLGTDGARRGREGMKGRVWYQQVIHACALHEDTAAMAGDDESQHPTPLVPQVQQAWQGAISHCCITPIHPITMSSRHIHPSYRRYQQVMHACALHEDTAAMAGGDEARVADRGLTLSGGQRARLALARALYSDATLLLLDDPLSALDARVARHVSDAALFGPIARGRTILLCTHSPPHIDLLTAPVNSPLQVRLHPTPASPMPHSSTCVSACWQAAIITGGGDAAWEDRARGTAVHAAPPLATHFHAPPPLLPLTCWQAMQRSSLVVAMQHGRIVHVAPPAALVPELMLGDAGVDEGACMGDADKSMHDGSRIDAVTRGLLVKLLGEQQGERDGEKGGKEGESSSLKGSGRGEGKEIAENVAAGEAAGELGGLSTMEGCGVSGAAACTTGAASEESRQEGGAPRPDNPDMKGRGCSSGGKGEKAGAALEEEERREAGSVRLSVYRRYCAAVGWPLLALVLASLALMQGSRNAADVTLSLWTDAVQHAPDSEAATNAFYLRLFTFIALLNSLLTLLRAFSFARAGMTAAHRVHHELLAAVVRTPLAFFDTNPSGRILNRFSSDLYTVDDSLPFIANILLANSFSLAGIAALLLYTQWTFLLLLLPLTYIYSIIQHLYRQSSRELRQLDSAARSPMYAAFSQLLHGAPTIRAFHAQEHMMRGAVALMSASQHASFSEMAASQWLSVRLQLMAAVVVTFVSVTGIMTTHSLPNVSHPNHLFPNQSPLNHSPPSSTAHQAFPLAPAAPHLPSPLLHLLFPDFNNTSSSFPLLSDPASGHTLPLPVNTSLLLPPLQSLSLPALPSISHHLSSLQTDGASALWLSPAARLAACPNAWSGTWSGVLSGVLSGAASSARARVLLKGLSSVPVIRSIITALQSLLSLALSAPRLLFESATTTTAAVSPGLLGLALAYALPIVSLLNGTLTSLADTEKDMVAVERVLEYLDLQHEPDAPPLSPLPGAKGQNGEGAWKDAHAEGEGIAVAGGGERGEWPKEGRVEFRHVSMAYRVGLPLVLSDVSFLIPGGSQVGIAGRTGAGKSSVLAALFRLRPLSLPSATTTTAITSTTTSSSTAHMHESSRASGIFIDGVDTAHVSLSCLRTALAIIPQTPLIFHAPIRDNLDPEGKHADVALWDAVRKCHLGAAVGRLGGLDAMVGGAAGGLSLGERQLLCLARVMLRKSKVLCLDECTANIDAATSALMHATIAREFHGVTTITVAHRVSSLLSLPRVLIFEAGALVCTSDAAIT
ncbi:unnamed protein product [Closterium sp. Naga37s-1]|nr:unnamed protein product [Closterium sp. Naga37s-1]